MLIRSELSSEDTPLLNLTLDFLLILILKLFPPSLPFPTVVSFHKTYPSCLRFRFSVKFFVLWDLFDLICILRISHILLYFIPTFYPSPVSDVSKHSFNSSNLQ